MSDSRDDVSHVFDQTNGVIDADAGEADGALSGRSASDVEGPTGAAATGSAIDRQEAAGVDGRDDPRRADPASPAADEHTYAVDSSGTATDRDLDRDGGRDRDDDGYSGAPAVAAWSAGDDGRDEGSTRADRSTEPVADASHTGRLADAYATGPTEEAGRDDGGSGRRTGGTAVAYSAGPTEEVGSTDRPESRDAEPDGTGRVGDERPERDRSGDPLAGVVDDDGSVAHVFDQTNGVIDGVDGESDGTAASDTASPADRGV